MDGRRILPYFFILIAGLAITFLLIRGGFSLNTAGLLIFLLVFIPTIINPNIGLAIIIVSMIYSPEAITGQTTARQVAVRVEDVLLMVVVFTWLVKTARTKDIAAPFRTKITIPFFLYMGVCVLATLFAATFDQIDIKQSFFSMLKYLEYFLLFIMVRDNLKNMRIAKFFVAIFLLTALLTATHTNMFIEKQLEKSVAFFRAAPPVETRKSGEAGILGGYFVFMMAIAGGLLVHTRSVPLAAFLICLELAMFRGFLYTLSRGSYIALIPALIALACFAKRGKLIFIYTLGVVAVLIMLFAPQMIKQRITKTVEIKIETEMGRADIHDETAVLKKFGVRNKKGIPDKISARLELEESPRLRLESFRVVLFERFPSSPLFGHGVAKFFIDGQIFLTLCEVGLLGLLLFAWVLARLFKMAKEVLLIDMVKSNNFSTGLTVGFLSGFVGLFAHSLGTNTFIVIKIMEPFWFIAAIVLLLPQLIEKETSEKTSIT